ALLYSSQSAVPAVIDQRILPDTPANTLTTDGCLKGSTGRAKGALFLYLAFAWESAPGNFKGPGW
ncbi:MAG: hypothetical protein WB622_13835, partial [Acidobacteriaceae bacterium]